MFRVHTIKHQLGNILWSPVSLLLHSNLVNGALRSVAYYDEAKYDSLYRREDIKTGYTPDESQAIIDDLTVQGLSRQYLEGLFNAGTLECSMFQFEEALMFHFPESDHTGLFVTIDAGTDIYIDQFVSVCESHLDVD